MWASESGGIQILVFQQVSNSTLYVNISGFVKRVTRWVSHVEQKLLIRSEDLCILVTFVLIAV